MNITTLKADLFSIGKTEQIGFRDFPGQSIPAYRSIPLWESSRKFVQIQTEQNDTDIYVRIKDVVKYLLLYRGAEKIVTPLSRNRLVDFLEAIWPTCTKELCSRRHLERLIEIVQQSSEISSSTQVGNQSVISLQPSGVKAIIFSTTACILGRGTEKRVVPALVFNNETIVPAVCCFIPPDFSEGPDAAYYFSNESKHLQNLRGTPHVVQLKESFLIGSDPHMLLDRWYTSLDNVKRRLFPEEKNQILKDLAKGLEHIHSQNLVHRDIKPSNVLLSEDHRACWADFGSCTKKDEGPDHHNVFSCGTRENMPPELRKVLPRRSGSQQAGIPSLPNPETSHDIWSFGWLILSLFKEETQEMTSSIPRKIDHTSLSMPRKALLKKMLSENPSDRPDAIFVSSLIEEPRLCHLLVLKRHLPLSYLSNVVKQLCNTLQAYHRMGDSFEDLGDPNGPLVSAHFFNLNGLNTGRAKPLRKETQKKDILKLAELLCAFFVLDSEIEQSSRRVSFESAINFSTLPELDKALLKALLDNEFKTSMKADFMSSCLENLTLDHLLTLTPFLSLRYKREIAKNLSQNLLEYHQRGVFFQYANPENILIEQADKHRENIRSDQILSPTKASKNISDLGKLLAQLFRQAPESRGSLRETSFIKGMISNNPPTAEDTLLFFEGGFPLYCFLQGCPLPLKEGLKLALQFVQKYPKAQTQLAACLLCLFSQDSRPEQEDRKDHEEMESSVLHASLQDEGFQRAVMGLRENNPPDTKEKQAYFRAFIKHLSLTYPTNSASILASFNYDLFLREIEESNFSDSEAEELYLEAALQRFAETHITKSPMTSDHSAQPFIDAVSKLRETYFSSDEFSPLQLLEEARENSFRSIIRTLAKTYVTTGKIEEQIKPFLEVQVIALRQASPVMQTLLRKILIEKTEVPDWQIEFCLNVELKIICYLQETCLPNLKDSLELSIEFCQALCFFGEDHYLKDQNLLWKIFQTDSPLKKTEEPSVAVYEDILEEDQEPRRIRPLLQESQQRSLWQKESVRLDTLKPPDIYLEKFRKLFDSEMSTDSQQSLATQIVQQILQEAQTEPLRMTLGKLTALRSMLDRLELSDKLGIELENLTPDIASRLGYSSDVSGVVISKVKPDSIAAKAGLRPYFLITGVATEWNDQKQVQNIQDFDAALKEAKDKKYIILIVRHQNFQRYYTIKLN